jgi:methionine-gamma-lyase
MTTGSKGFGSKLVHAGAPKDAYGSVVTPIYQTSTFAFETAKQGADRFSGKEDGFIYTRLGNPTVRALEECVAALEGGAGAVATSSGMGAVTTAYLALLASGDHVVSTASVYGPSRMLMEKHLAKFGLISTYVDTSDLDQVRRALRPETKMVYVETPSNPLMQITDLAAVAALAHANGATLVVDSTFASPYLQQPLALGADVVLHSVTKFINGHADAVGGILVAKEAATAARLRQTMTLTGCNMDPHQAFLVHRGLKTLSLRIERAQASAARIATWLEARPDVAWVRYVGLPSHPQYDLARRQMSGPGAMISFELEGGLAAGERLMNRVKLAALAVSLGGVETLIEHPASMTHSGVPEAERREAGITDGLVRYSVGIEDPEDLIEDLRQALDVRGAVAPGKGENRMVVCIPVNEDKGLESEVCAHFGSTPEFLIVETESSSCRAIPNRNQHHGHGMCAPIASLDGERIDAIVVGGIGMGALNKLLAAGIEVFMAEHATVRETLAAFTAGALKPVQPGMACAHHGHGHGGPA